MAYVPAYNALFVKPLLNQLMAIVQRDQAAAIALVNPSLSPIAEFHKGPGLRTAFPWLALSAEDISFVPDVVGTRQSRSRVSMALDVGQFDQEMAQDNAQDYARVLDVVVTTAASSDWESPLPVVHETVPGGTTTPPAPGSVKEVFVESHNYGLVTLQQIDAPVLRVTLNLQFQLEEA